MNCPHCGKDISENAVKHWRENLVRIPGEKTQVESICNFPAPVKHKDGWVRYTKRGSVESPVLVVVSEATE